MRTLLAFGNLERRIHLFRPLLMLLLYFIVERLSFVMIITDTFFVLVRFQKIQGFRACEGNVKIGSFFHICFVIYWEYYCRNGMITNRGISLLFRCGASVEDVTQSMKSTYQHPSWRQQLKLLVHHAYAYQAQERM